MAKWRAIVVGQPLILAGEPGVGKTQFARALAVRLDCEIQPTLHVKSTTAGRDLLYVFDEVARFRAGSGAPLRDFVNFNSLGRAILWSAGPAAPAPIAARRLLEVAGPELAHRFADRPGALTLGDIFPDEFKPASRPTALTAPERSLALIDELDKAPRDAPNDVLHEFDRMSFIIQEMGLPVKAQPDHWPIVIITSNSERSLPDAFLRRCVFHWIAFPEPARLRRIVAAHCARAAGVDLSPEAPLFVGAVKLFEHLRDAVPGKKPSTAELIAFVHMLRREKLPLDREPEATDPQVQGALGLLFKGQVDLDEARDRLWRDSNGRADGRRR